MIKIKHQEYLGIGLIGVIFILYGVFSYLCNVNVFFIIADILLALYWLFRFFTRKVKKEKDDDLSLADKMKAGYKSFCVGVTVLFLYCGYQVISTYNKGSFVIMMDLRILCIIVGAWILSYCFFYRQLEKQGEDYDEN